MMERRKEKWQCVYPGNKYILLSSFVMCRVKWVSKIEGVISLRS